MVAGKHANLRTAIAEERSTVCGDLRALSELPDKEPADTVLRQSRLVISPPVSLGNDTSMSLTVLNRGTACPRLCAKASFGLH